MQISEAVNILLDLYYSSHDSQPHSINVRNFFNIIRGDLPTSPKKSFLFVVVVCSLVSNAIRLFALGAMGFACRLFLSHGPLRFITSNSLFALASTLRKTKRLSRRLK